MAYFALGILVLAFLLLAGRAFLRTSPRRLASVVRIFGVVLCVAAIVIVIVAGRSALAPLFFGLLLPLLLRWWDLRRVFRNANGPTPGQQTEVETATLRMRLDHDSGTMSGTILTGRHRGQELHELTTAELLALLRTCRVDDTEAARLLEAYLDRTQPGWREAEEGAGTGGQDRTSGSGPGDLTTEEAYRILGLEPGAGPDEIRRAHRDLMQRMHPDRGGSAYLAAKINAAKDLLLRS